MKLETTNYEICLNMPSHSKARQDSLKLRIALLSDLHDTVYGEDNKYLLERVQREKPDIVIIAGDLVTARKGRDFSPALSLLKNLAESHSVYYGIGNHEQKLDAAKNPYMREIRKIPGVKVLDNETLIYDRENDICITGLSLPRKFYEKGRKNILDVSDINAAVGEKKHKVTILIAHNPIYFETYAEWGADVVLSGHMHGGIVRLPFVGGVLSPQISLFPKYDKGLFRLKGSVMVVSAGLGKHTVPVRLWNPAELAMIDILL